MDVIYRIPLVNLCEVSAVKALPINIDEILVDINCHFPHSVKSIASLKDYADFCEVEFEQILSTVKQDGFL